MGFAQVTSTRGSVSLTRPGQPAQALFAGMELAAGDVVSTGADSRVGVDFEDGRGVVVGDSARVRLVESGMGYESVKEDDLVVYGNTVVARLSRPRGDVRVYRDGEGELVVADGLDLFQGDLVSTGPGASRARVVSLDGAQRVLGGGTSERVGQPGASRASTDVSSSVVESTDANGNLRRDVTVSVPVVNIEIGASAPGG